MKKKINKFTPPIVASVSIVVCLLLYILAENHNRALPPKVSAIVPVYNTEKYLDDCLTSIENQTLKDIEIICINDGSTDNSLKILESHASRDDRIKIINQENQGVSVARNKGIEAATGEYISFMDSDDLLVDFAYDKAYENASRFGVDILEFGCLEFFDGEDFTIPSYEHNYSKVVVRKRYKNQDPFETFKLGRGPTWDKLWKREFILNNNLKFCEGASRGEDTIFNNLSIPLTYKTVSDGNPLYCYRRHREGSLMNISESDVKKKLDSYLILIDYFIDKSQNINFDGSDNWKLKTIMELSYDFVVKLKEKGENVKDYATRSLNLVNKFLSINNITPSEDYQQLIEHLHQMAEI
ncbi:MAG: glycosyltransferase family 2 protein [Acutalibacteraceae bacterium]